jgi:hypothetical protein
MAGWRWGVDVATSLTSGAAIVDRAIVVSERFALRTVSRLRWPELHGSSAAEWESFGLSPAEAGYTHEHEPSEEIVASLDDAIATLGRWTGVALHFDVPPHALEPSPSIYDACVWRVGFLDRWRVRVVVEYPMRSDAPSPAWVAALEARIAHAFG